MTALEGRAFVLLYGPLRIGGIETLMLRLSRWLAERGAAVTICCQPGGALERSVDSRVRVVHFRRTRELVRMADDIGSVDARRILLLTFDPISAARGLQLHAALHRRHGRATSHLSGVFHPQAYFMPGERADRVALNRAVARAVGPDALFFMNAECRDSHAARWRIDLTRAPVLPLPVDDAPCTWSAVDDRTVRVLSIGRLVPFKAYNLGAPAVVRACADAGVRVRWDIVGDGDLAPEIRARAERLGVSDEVRLRGSMAYEALPGAFDGYDLFVGMGTAALQAAMTGLPTLCAIVGRERETYGTLDEVPFGNVGELIPGRPTSDLAARLRAYARATSAERAALSHRSRRAAERYGIERFVEALLALSDAHGRAPRPTAPATGAIYAWATESAGARLGRRLRTSMRS